jgi:peptide/nickel transport system permease protein
MFSYIFRRLLMLFPILIGVSFLTYAIAHATPGDPVLLMLGNGATPEKVAQLRQELGFNDPFLVQYVRYVWRALHGDLGHSIRGGKPIIDDILARFPSTLQLTLAAMTFSVITGVCFGVIAGTTRHRWVDNIAMLISLGGLSIPDFWLAIILVLVFGVTLKWVSVAGGGSFKDLLLPAFCLGLQPAAVLARLTRSSILDVVREDYIRTARAKGLTDRLIIWKHILRNALIPVVTVIGLNFGAMMGGAVFIEAVFARPGLGRFAVAAISARDYPQIQGTVLFLATVYVLINLAVDVLYGFIDPRIRFQ